MCGISGLFDLATSPRERDPANRARAMVDTLAHRGPDGSDSWGDADAGIGLGHRRLAIVDLTPGGAQPMHSADGRYVIIYNGEVYNFQDLRSELIGCGHVFRSTSDTEVMLAAIQQWGLEKALARFIGMFAFALFDRQTRSLHLVRDRLGVKPLYWTIAGGTFLFGSELRALMAHPSFQHNVDPEAIAAVLRYSYVPAPATVFRSTHKLPPGSVLTIRPGAEPALSRYWRLDEVVAKRNSKPLPFQDAVIAVEELLYDSVRRRLIADVPVGAFLSGGTDSAAVVAMMQKASDRAARTFTIGFSDAAYDERAYAAEVAAHLRTEHTEIVLDQKSALDLVQNIAEWFDEPFGDSSQLPTYLVSRETRKHVTVALSGDGGDELFGGYPKYSWLDGVWNSAGRLPRPVRAMLGRAASAIPEPHLERLAGLLLDPGRSERIGEKARRLGAALASPTSDDAALALAAVGLNDTTLVRGAEGFLHPRFAPEFRKWLPDLISRMQAQDMSTYLPDDILTKVDRCSMAVSLEAREPLLDHRLVELLWSLPPEIHRGGSGSKGLLRAVLARYIPPAMIDRSKRGFSVPLAQWLRGPLRDWAEDLLSSAKLVQDGFFDPVRTNLLWQRHVSGAENNATGLWNILMVCAWSNRWLKS